MSDEAGGNEGTVISVLSQMLERVMSQGKIEEEKSPEKKNFTFYLNLPDEEILKTIVEIDESMTIEAAMLIALPSFKTALLAKGLSLDTQLHNFTPRLAKKSGKPKTDMPGIYIFT